MVSMPIVSQPTGAVVTLVGPAGANVIGRTPVAAAIDPAQTYDVVVTAPGYVTRIEHVTAAAHDVAVTLIAKAHPRHHRKR
jgi:hypothetical protein